MLENIESLLPLFNQKEKPKVVSIGFDQESLEELYRLLTTLGVEAVGSILVGSHRKVHPSTYVGKGKIEETLELLTQEKADAVVVDVELSPNQLRNLEKMFGRPTLDRPGIIIEIFSRHARTRESKTQVALARLQYLLPRLTHFWTHFERQRGGAPGSRGMGEKQIEVDRRLVKKRIALLRQRLKDIEQERMVQRAGRKEVLKVALVGYTNAGKSTLLNALTHSEVRAEDKLFATLDASVRLMDPHSHPPIIVIDTVGFIHRLPPALVASFRSTLEELREADLLLHIVDASHPQAREQIEVTEKILNDLGVDQTPRLTILNKMDQIGSATERNRTRVLVPRAIPVSALVSEDMVQLRKKILDYFHQELEMWEILLPYTESKLESQIYAYGSVEESRHLDRGTFLRIRIEKSWAKKLGLERYRL